MKVGLLAGFFPALLLAVISLASPASAGTFEQELLDLINGYRAEQSLKPLKAFAEYDTLAQEHSQAMQQEKRMSHDGFSDRFERSGSNACVENVGWNHKTPAAQFNGWKNSPGHNKNMLAPKTTRAGIGKAGAYVTFFACK